MDNFYFDPRGKIAIFPKDSVVDNFYSAQLAAHTVDDINPALPTIRNIPYFPYFWVLTVMQDFFHQQ